ncbi:hypothetical protein Daus18300_008215 [Diaporthe australafricana]|uniref:Uncharacterized protein n=1 Tax=Diaporthe australafricana TaxID=127596 RepID=A0ABR3WJC2_9PEZI
MAQPQTILQCFATPLPTYQYNGGKHTPEQGGSTSQNTRPPKFAILRDQNDRWAHRGHAWLNSLNGLVNNFIAQQQQLVAANPQQAANAGQTIQWARNLLQRLNNEFIYNKESAILHRNEADVVRTAALYLIHPVCQALDSFYRYNNTISSQCEDFMQGLRTDISFYRTVQPAAVQRCFAVVEFKRRTLIRPDAFQKALQQYDPTAPNAPQRLTAIVNAIPAPAAGK